MKVIALLYAGYVALMVGGLMIAGAFGEDHCSLMECEPGYDYNWADYVGAIGFLLALLAIPVTVVAVVAFLIAAIVAAGRRGNAAAHETFALGAIVLLAAALPTAWFFFGS